MTITHGFELIRDAELAEINATARIYRHQKTGAQLLSVIIDDENKVFGISFRTPPTDSTGVPHIMEHAVLAGSEKYPLKEPFIELVKGSLASFVNAMTFPDKTIYPVASTNVQDFYNLIDVYMDAVLHPLLTPEHLYQEGWHYETEGPDAPLTYKGVVFNEMKGAYSSPDSLMGKYGQETLFPDTTYGFDSGGDPTFIPDLTYEQFKTFHDTYYHPSNAQIYFYGDDDPEERLRLMNDYLSGFEPIEVESAVTLQAPFPAPRRHNFSYSVSGDNGSEDKAYVQLNWLLPEYSDTEQVMALEILSDALLSTPASPLRKALMDSGLGEEVTGGGLSTWTRQMTFSAGLKGVTPDNAPQVEALIMDTLGTLAEEGIDPATVESAVNTMEFQLRENNTGRYPRGLFLMMRALGTWLHDGDPLAPLMYEAPLASLKEKLAADPEFLSALIGEHLLDNPHRTTVVLEPDPTLGERLEAEERARLDAARIDMTDADIQRIMDEAALLSERQGTPDPPELLATLPMLTLEDLDRENKTIPLEISELAGGRLLRHDLFTNGIVYLDVGMNLHALPAELLPYVELFGQALVEMGTETEDFVKLSQRIGRTTGGIAPTTLVAPVKDSDEATAWLVLRGKATMDQAQDMLDIMRDVLLSVKLDDQERFRQMVLENKAGQEGRLAPAGHAVVNSRLRAHFHPAYWVDEQLGGVSQLFFLRRLAEQVDADWPAVLEKLEMVRRLLVNGSQMLYNVTLDDENYASFGPQLEAFAGSIPHLSVNKEAWVHGDLPDNEGLAFPAQVNYVGKGADLAKLGYTSHGSMNVITNLLRTGYLWEKIRMQGGAYGAFALYSRLTGVFSFLSYRDPNLTGTLANFDGAADYLRRVHLDEDELTRSIIGAIGSIDSYQLPDAKGYTSLMYYLTGESDEDRQQMREEVLATSEADFRALADVLEAMNEAGEVVVLGSADALNKANEDSGLGLMLTKVL